MTWLKNSRIIIFIQVIMSLIASLIFSSYYLLAADFIPSTITILGLSFLSFGLIWGFLFVIRYFWCKKPEVFLLFPFFVFASIGMPFLLEEIRLLDFILYVGVGLGICLLLAGLYWKLIGLTIPGALMVGIAPGLYFAWENANTNNPLEQTGIMLVGFAFGWGLITVTSRTLTRKFVWWPLIPGGILAVVGWGLYIAGNPESAIGFIGNTGSVGLIIFGIYILLMRRSFHR